MATTKSTSYDHYAKVYDRFKGDRQDNSTLLRTLIHEHRPKAKSILELACGTGALLAELGKDYVVSGLDNSAAMLEKARQKLPKAHFTQADMTNFRLRKKFDVIYCVHNSVNHLVLFEDWVALFERAAQHLKKDGIFIFDINTEERMEWLTSLGIGFHPVDEHYVVTKITRHPTEPGQYNWEMRIFLQKDPYSFSLHPTLVKVSTYPVEQVVRALGHNFAIVDTFTLQQTLSRDDLHRMYFVCRKV